VRAIFLLASLKKSSWNFLVRDAVLGAKKTARAIERLGIASRIALENSHKAATWQLRKSLPAPTPQRAAPI